MLNGGPPPDTSHQMDKYGEVQDNFSELQVRLDILIKRRILYHLLNVQHSNHLEEAKQLKAAMDQSKKLDAEARQQVELEALRVQVFISDEYGVE